jgi:protocatechuate 3,4-dioxygenase beta subunit
MGMPTHLLTATLVTLLVTTNVAAQDVEFVRALERAQQAQPAKLAATARIAPESEPGTPLVIHGRAYAADRKTPLANAVIFAYHTDKDGLYDRPGTSNLSWRLRGWAQTDGEGRFEFQTIRPGAYPGRKVAEHVHFNVFTASGERYHAGELHFADDSIVSGTERATSEREGDFGAVRPVRRDGQVQHVDFRIRLEPEQKF